MVINKADYIYIERTYGKRNNIEMKEDTILGLKWLSVLQTVKEKRKRWIRNTKVVASGAGFDVRYNNVLVKKLKKYCNEDTIVMGKEATIKELGIPAFLPHMRKKELLCNAKDLLRYFQMNKIGRSKFLLVIKSNFWSLKEVIQLLWEVKDYYEDIYVVADDSKIDTESLCHFFCEECGIVLHPVNEDVATTVQMDAVLFLIEEWQEQHREYCFRKGYVVAEWEGTMQRKRKSFRKEQIIDDADKELYSGFVYENERKQIMYEMAITLLGCRYLQPCSKEVVKENPISIVAIYGVE